MDKIDSLGQAILGVVPGATIRPGVDSVEVSHPSFRGDGLVISISDEGGSGSARVSTRYAGNGGVVTDNSALTRAAVSVSDMLSHRGYAVYHSGV